MLGSLDWVSPGRKVVCVDDRSTIGFDWEAGSQPSLDTVYTIRAVGPTVYGGLGIMLMEIKLWSPKRNCELFYRAGRFRPVVSRETDISALRSLLNPNNHNELA